MTGLLAILGYFAGGQIIHALIAEHGTTKQPTEIPGTPARDAKPEASTCPEACASAHANVSGGLLTVGMFALLGSVPMCSNIVNKNWGFKWKADVNPQGEGKA